MRAAAIHALWRGGAALRAIEAALGSSDGRAAGEYLAFLARRQLHAELVAAHRRLVERNGLQPTEPEAAYIARTLAR